MHVCTCSHLWSIIQLIASWLINSTTLSWYLTTSPTQFGPCSYIATVTLAAIWYRAHCLIFCGYIKTRLSPLMEVLFFTLYPFKNLYKILYQTDTDYLNLIIALHPPTVCSECLSLVTTLYLPIKMSPWTCPIGLIQNISLSQCCQAWLSYDRPICASMPAIKVVIHPQRALDCGMTWHGWI